MSPVPTPDDLEAARPFIDKLGPWIRFVMGSGVAAWIALKFAGRVGVEKRKYEELREDVDAHTKRMDFFVTYTELGKEQELCRGAIRAMVKAEVHDAIDDVKEQLSYMNGNLCHLMGRMNVEPLENPKKRRRADQQD